jgi:hypothetical protein
MGKREYTLLQPKKGCVDIGLAVLVILFLAGGIIASVANIFYNFSITTLLAAVAIIAVCSGLGYVFIKSNFNKKPPVIIMDNDGIQAVGMGMVKKEKFSWVGLNIQTGYSDPAKARFINIGVPGLPIIVNEKTIGDFDEFVETVKSFQAQALQSYVRTNTVEISGQHSESGTGREDARAQSHQRAVEWWEQSGQTEAICDGCNRPLTKPAGFLVGSYLYCHQCAQDKF